MRNITTKSKLNRSLALTSDAHLSQFHSQTEVFEYLSEEYVKFKEHVYLDFDVVRGGAIFFFIPYEKFINDCWDNIDTLEVFIEFEEQRIYFEEFCPQRGVIQSDRFKLIDNDHERFDLAIGLSNAEKRAFKYISEK